MYYTYTLLSKCGKRTYTGSTHNLRKRIEEHNKGKVKSSSYYGPYELINAEEFTTLKEAKAKELFYKSTTGRRRLRLIIKIVKKIISTNRDFGETSLGFAKRRAPKSRVLNRDFGGEAKKKDE